MQGLLDGPGYPGETPDLLAIDVHSSPPQHLKASDLDRFWAIDFRNPKGFTPLGMVHLELGYCWGSQAAARSGPVPSGDGFEVRLVGPYCYSTERPLADTSEGEPRRCRLVEIVDGLPENFATHWATVRDGLVAHNQRYRRRDLSQVSLAELGRELLDARAFLKSTWETHFALMYPLLALQSSFYALATELGIARAEVAELLKSAHSAVTECDSAITTLALDLRERGLGAWLAETLATGVTMGSASPSSPDAIHWLEAFTAFLDRHGWRADAVGDPASPSWIEEPAIPLGHILALAERPDLQPMEQTLQHARKSREMLESDVRNRLSTPERKTFDLALADIRRANFAWWQEDHNTVIDMAAMLPLRQVAREIGRKLDLAEGEVDFLFCRELLDLTAGRRLLEHIAPLIPERRAYLHAWQERRAGLPRHFGPVPEAIDDALFVEIEGMTPAYLAALRGDSPLRGRIEGTPASGGKVEGRARVIFDTRDLASVRHGEVLVCEGSTPSWTPVFGRITACLADQGGTLSHTAIIAREHGLPCIVALGRATQAIKTGDRLIVDADRGVVEILDAAT